MIKKYKEAVGCCTATSSVNNPLDSRLAPRRHGTLQISPIMSYCLLETSQSPNAANSPGFFSLLSGLESLRFCNIVTLLEVMFVGKPWSPCEPQIHRSSINICKYMLTSRWNSGTYLLELYIYSLSDCSFCSR